ncbi:MAG: cation:proton antiporter [Candidatus Bilamarchaeaceae archaeon]
MFEIFFILGLTILIGFAATSLFERTRISEVIILMLFGFLLGPVFHIVDTTPGSVIVSILPFIATLALIVLLFDGGMTIDVFAVARSIQRSTVFTLVVFVISVVFVTIFTTLLLGWPPLNGILLGAVIGGTSSAIVIAMVEKVNISNDTKSLLIIESTITDALCIITAGIMIQLIVAHQTPEAGTVVNLLLSSFTIALLMGVVCAASWIALMKKFSTVKYAYMLTLAAVFGLYAVTEAIKANGGFAVFIFGLVLGNAREIGNAFGTKFEAPLNPMIHLFQEEITFFIRTFFFVYIGLLISPAYFNIGIIGISIALLVLLAASRWAAQKALLTDIPPRERNIVIAMLPRGLAAAVLATIPLASGIVIPSFQELVFSLIFFSNIVATGGIFIFDRKRKTETKSTPQAPGTEAQISQQDKDSK